MQDSELIKLLKDIRDFIFLGVILQLASEGEVYTDTISSIDSSINTGDIAPGDTVEYVIQVPSNKVLACESISYKLAEWWTTDFEWIRDGVTIYKESNTVDNTTPSRVIPAFYSSVIKITNNSTTYSQKAIIRWHYAIADLHIYNSFITGIFKKATEIIREVSGVEGS